MTFVWLFFWLLAGAPMPDFVGEWDSWAFAFVVCAALDVLAYFKTLLR